MLSLSGKGTETKKELRRHASMLRMLNEWFSLVIFIENFLSFSYFNCLVTNSDNYWSIIYALCISVIKRLTHFFLVILLFPIAITFTITIITDSFNMPARSAFWPCGDCRKSCTANSVQRDTCNSWYHYQCQQLDLVDIEYLVTPDATFTCKNCCFAEFGQYNQYSYESLLLRLRVVCYALNIIVIIINYY